MKVVCVPNPETFVGQADLKVALFNPRNQPQFGRTGSGLGREFKSAGLSVEQRAWDFLAIALAVMASDNAGNRGKSEDGWTRQFDVTISVSDPIFWNSQSSILNKALSFLTTDIWNIDFIEGGDVAPEPSHPIHRNEKSVVLLSGGLDSLVGAIDLKANNEQPYAVGQTPKDGSMQKEFANSIGIPLLLLNHNTTVPNQDKPASQRGRSIIFIAFGVAVATALEAYKSGEEISLYVCENGLISINPPLTPSRIGSLSTRTTHPHYLSLLQEVLTNAGLHVAIKNPYQLKTKGQMLNECLNQDLLVRLAPQSISCGRFKRNNFNHCGRCLPCQIRRAAFHAWSGHSDDTPTYKHQSLGQNDPQHSGFDDVRSVGMALAQIRLDGIENWLGSSVSSALIPDYQNIIDMVRRGMTELSDFHRSQGL